MAKATTAPKNQAKPSKDADDGITRKVAKVPAKPKDTKPNVFQRFSNYLKDVRTEMRRVVWPTREEVINYSVVVIVTIIFFVLFTWVVDQFAFRFMDLLSQLGRSIGG